TGNHPDIVIPSDANPGFVDPGPSPLPPDPFAAGPPISTASPHADRFDFDRFLGGSVTVLGNVIYQEVDANPVDPEPSRPRPSDPGA
ncbi:MAG: hypothetical protein LC745_04755, partial [Planctomycetia bacterium]|nr:hypothetical protein [Planctomycetia bacterium]